MNSREVKFCFQPKWLAVSTILLAGVAVYFNSFAGSFVYDDFESIRDNAHIRRLWPLSNAMSLPLINGSQTVARRPLLSLSFALNQFFLGPEPWGFHLVNLAIHLSAALLLFEIVRRTLCLNVFRSRYNERSTILAFAVSLVWMVHPLQTESVTYIVQRAESLMGMLYLLMLYCSIRGFQGSLAVERPTGHEYPNSDAMIETDKPSTVSREWGWFRGRRVITGMAFQPTYWYVAAVLACAVGMAVKEVMVTAPILVFLYDGSFVSSSYKFAWKSRPRFYMALAATWLIVLCLQVFGLKGMSEDFTHRSPMDYALTQPGVILYYLRLSIWPDPMVMDYGWPTARTAVEIVPAGCIVALLFGVSIWRLCCRCWTGFLGAWFFVILAPTSSVVAIVQRLEEHRMYLSLAAIVCLAVFVSDHLLRKMRSNTYRRAIAVSLLLPAVILLSARTIYRNHDYRDQIALWKKNLEDCPDPSAAHFQLGNAYLDLEQLSDAKHHFERSVLLRPQLATGYNNLGEVLRRQGKLTDAMTQFRKSLRVQPNQSAAHFNLADAFYERRDLRRAIWHYRQGLSVHPDDAKAHGHLGMALVGLNMNSEAIRHYRKAIRLNPDSDGMRFNLGNALLKQGNAAEAIACYRQALKKQCDNVAIHNNLALAYACQRQFSKAISHYKTSLKIDPRSVVAHRNLGNIYLGRGEEELAIAHYSHVLRINSDSWQAHLMLSTIYLKHAQHDQATHHLQEVHRIRPDLTVVDEALQQATDG